MLGAALDGRAGADSPSTRRVRELLEQFSEAVNRYAPEATEGDAAPEAQEAAAGALTEGAAAGGAPARLATRDDALRTLEDLATFFRRTEPNSPLAYTLQDAVRRARLSWPDLLAEVVPDAATRSAILSSLGIQPPAAAEE
jgi:type VI secretion system protein ImpA